MEKSNKEYVVDVNNLIALCYILDEYPTFSSNLSNFILHKYNREKVYSLYQISYEKKKKLFSGKVKKFYKENKEVIDKINKFSDVSRFINLNFDSQGDMIEESEIDFFYEYFIVNRDKLDKILLVLEKIKSLGYNEIHFDETNHFETKEYRICADLNIEFSFFDNISIIPNYSDNVINYRPLKSNYKMDFNLYDKSITLNNFLFDSHILPESLDKEYLFKKVLEEKKKCKDKIRKLPSFYCCSQSNNTANKMVTTEEPLIEDDVQKEKKLCLSRNI